MHVSIILLIIVTAQKYSYNRYKFVSDMSFSEIDGFPEYVPIEYRNESKDPKVVVVVASKNVSPQDSDGEKLVAWKILATQTKIFFSYPKATQVGCFYKHDHEIIVSGPFLADPGSSWKISQDSRYEAPLLLEGLTIYESS